MARKYKYWEKGSMKFKLIMSLSFIAAILMLSHFISILEYRRMSDTLTNSIAADTKCLNAAHDLAFLADDHNMNILNAVNLNEVTIDTLSREGVVSYYEILFANSTTEEALDASRKLIASYEIYRKTSNQYNDLVAKVDTVEHFWYYENIKPLYDTMKDNMEVLKSVLNQNLIFNSENFEAGFYRSIIPGVVADIVGLVLITLLAYFIISYYVNPLYKMLYHLQSYRTTGKRYNYEFEGDDQLSELNSSISEIAEENTSLKRRIKALKENNQDT